MTPGTAAERRQRAAALAASLGAHALAASALALAPGVPQAPERALPAPRQPLQVVWVDAGAGAALTALQPPRPAREAATAAPPAPVPSVQPPPRPPPRAAAAPPATVVAAPEAAPPPARPHAPPPAVADEPVATPAAIALAAAPTAGAARSAGDTPTDPTATGAAPGTAGQAYAAAGAGLATAAVQHAPARAGAAGDGVAGLRRITADHAACPPARYPALLRERGIEGVVQLRVKVGPDGRAAEVQLQRGSGWRLLDEAALAQARGCSFRPAVEGERPVAEWVEFPVRFALGG
jgi:protein TonB